MIVFFSGTGNSEYVAKNLLGNGEELISITELMRSNTSTLELEEGEALGFVFPVYFYTLPTIVSDFIQKVQFRNASYVYSVITCGGGTGQASAVLHKELQQKGMTLSYFRELLMPDNGMLFYQIPEMEEAEVRLDDALPIIAEIREDISARETTAIKGGTALASILGLGYSMCSGTKKFYAEDSCIGCGLCERNCPQQVIQMVDGKPVWTKPNCCKCSSCINRCPVSAIQYGSKTKKRNRYANPRV